LNARKKLDKAVIVGESNDEGVWGRSPHPPETNVGLGAEPPTLKRFLQYFFKNYAFLSILWSKFLLKTRFKMIAKSVLMRPRARAPTCLHPPRYANVIVDCNKSYQYRNDTIFWER